MAEILVDAKLWNKAFKHMRPQTVAWVRENKGAGKGKIFPANLIAIVSKEKIEIAFIMDVVVKQHLRKSRVRSYLDEYIIKQGLISAGLSVARQREISKAIALVAVDEGILPETVLFGSSRLIQPLPASKRDQVQKGFVYFVKNGDIYKVGITDNLLRRIGELRPDEVLNIVRCSNYQELEKVIHKEFSKSRIPQTEYFRLTADQVEDVHKLMTSRAVF